MTLSLARMRKPGVFSTVLTLAGMALFLRLGFWQLDRADEKSALLTQFEMGQQSTVPATWDTADTLPRYQRVEMRGRYDPDRQILLDNMPSMQGRPGYRVLTPLRVDGGVVLVDRGWLPLGANREELPQIDVDDDLRTVLGRLDELPAPGLRLGESTQDEHTDWPRVYTFPQHEQLERALQAPLARRVVVLEASQPDGYERATELPAHIVPGRHIAYAVQWFAFALLAVILFFVMHLRSGKTGDDSVR